METWTIGCTSIRPPMRKICPDTGGREAGVPRIALGSAGSFGKEGSSLTATVSGVGAGADFVVVTAAGWTIAGAMVATG